MLFFYLKNAVKYFTPNKKVKSAKNLQYKRKIFTSVQKP